MKPKDAEIISKMIRATSMRDVIEIVQTLAHARCMQPGHDRHVDSDWAELVILLHPAIEHCRQKKL